VANPRRERAFRREITSELSLLITKLLRFERLTLLIRNEPQMNKHEPLGCTAREMGLLDHESPKTLTQCTLFRARFRLMIGRPPSQRARPCVLPTSAVSSGEGLERISGHATRSDSHASPRPCSGVTLRPRPAAVSTRAISARTSSCGVFAPVAVNCERAR
jgi:hypothetical protein